MDGEQMRISFILQEERVQLPLEGKLYGAALVALESWNFPEQAYSAVVVWMPEGGNTAEFWRRAGVSRPQQPGGRIAEALAKTFGPDTEDFEAVVRVAPKSEMFDEDCERWGLVRTLGKDMYVLVLHQERQEMEALHARLGDNFQWRLVDPAEAPPLFLKFDGPPYVSDQGFTVQKMWLKHVEQPGGVFAAVSVTPKTAGDFRGVFDDFTCMTDDNNVVWIPHAKLPHLEKYALDPEKGEICSESGEALPIEGKILICAHAVCSQFHVSGGSMGVGVYFIGGPPKAVVWLQNWIVKMTTQNTPLVIQVDR